MRGRCDDVAELSAAFPGPCRGCGEEVWFFLHTEEGAGLLGVLEQTGYPHDCPAASPGVTEEGNARDPHPVTVQPA